MPIRDRLSDIECRTATPAAKPRRLFDGGGLYLEVAPAGGKWWRLKYRVGGKEKRISLGTYPEVSLKEARGKRDEARKQLDTGVDPSTLRKARRAAAKVATGDSFEDVARDWVKKRKDRWSKRHSEITLGRLTLYAFPRHGKQHIAAVSAPDLLVTLRGLEALKHFETAHRVRQICSQVFRYGIAIGKVERDPAADLRGALAPVKGEHLAALIEPKAVATLLLAIDGYHGGLVTRCALRLAPLVFVRPGELRSAEWGELDLDKAEWNIPASKMKMRQPHLVPLATQAVALLRELEPRAHRSSYVFPSIRSTQKPMSNNTVLAALRTIGFTTEQMTGHGFRATARTLLDEELGFPPHLIEHQLAHRVKDGLGRAYNRTSHLPQRREMMQTWADFLDTIKEKERADLAAKAQPAATRHPPAGLDPARRQEQR